MTSTDGASAIACCRSSGDSRFGSTSRKLRGVQAISRGLSQQARGPTSSPHAGPGASDAVSGCAVSRVARKARRRSQMPADFPGTPNFRKALSINLASVGARCAVLGDLGNPTEALSRFAGEDLSPDRRSGRPCCVRRDRPSVGAARPGASCTTGPAGRSYNTDDGEPSGAGSQRARWCLQKNYLPVLCWC
jgi:hypothetical protein